MFASNPRAVRQSRWLFFVSLRIAVEVLKFRVQPSRNVGLFLGGLLKMLDDCLIKPMEWFVLSCQDSEQRFFCLDIFFGSDQRNFLPEMSLMGISTIYSGFQILLLFAPHCKVANSHFWQQILIKALARARSWRATTNRETAKSNCPQLNWRRQDEQSACRLIRVVNHIKGETSRFAFKWKTFP